MSLKECCFLGCGAIIRKRHSDGSTMLLLDADKTQRLNFFGEDTCDLLRTIEVSFGVMFSEDELVEAKTIGELAECISRKMQHSLAEKCLSALVFYQVRRILMSSFGISRAKITPETPLRELLPWKDRRRRWREIHGPPQGPR